MTAGFPRPKLPIGEVLGGGWRCVTSSFVAMVIGYFLFVVITSIVSGVTFGVGAIILAGPMWLGMCNIALRASRSQSPGVGDLFSGFQSFGPSFLAFLLLMVMMLVAFAAIVIPTGAAVFFAISSGSAVLFVLAASIGGTLCMVPGFAFAILYSPTFFFIGDHDMGAWEAMESSRKMVMRNLGQWLVLWLVLGLVPFLLPLIGTLLSVIGALLSSVLLSIAGFILSFVLMFLVTPWVMGALAIAYNLEQGPPAILPLPGTMPPPMTGGVPPMTP